MTIYSVKFSYILNESTKTIYNQLHLDQQHYNATNMLIHQLWYKNIKNILPAFQELLLHFNFIHTLNM